LSHFRTQNTARLVCKQTLCHGSVYSSDTCVVFKHTSYAGMRMPVRYAALRHIPDASAQVPDGAWCITCQTANWRIWRQAFTLSRRHLLRIRRSMVDCIMLRYIKLSVHKFCCMCCCQENMSWCVGTGRDLSGLRPSGQSAAREVQRLTDSECLSARDMPWCCISCDDFKQCTPAGVYAPSLSSCSCKSHLLHFPSSSLFLLPNSLLKLALVPALYEWHADFPTDRVDHGFLLE